MKSRMHTWLPFLDWFPLSGIQIRADLLAGLTVALIAMLVRGPARDWFNQP